MRTEEMMTNFSEQAKDDVSFEVMRRGLPLGVDSANTIVVAQKQLKPVLVRNTCVTGVNKTQFIRRLLLTLSCVNTAEDVCFFIISPNQDYGELLRLSATDFTIPYIRTKADVAQAVETLKELLRMREAGKGYPHIILVLDGLESLTDCNKNSDLQEYLSIFELFSRRIDVDIISGVELGRSIFAGSPGAFLGKGNCLVTTRESGKADVTYVNDDCSLTTPLPITYPNEPTVMESIIYLNALPKA